MEELMEFMRGLDWSPLLISLKTGVVATILSFLGGIFAARQVIKVGPKTKAVLDGRKAETIGWTAVYPIWEGIKRSL